MNQRLTTSLSHCSALAVALQFSGGAVGSLLGTYDSSYTYPGTHLMDVNGLDGES